MSIVVTPPANHSPTPTFTSFTMDEDTSYSGTLTATDPEGDALTFAKVSNPAHGSVTVDANGNFTYVPNANYNGSDSFTYSVSDGTNAAVSQVVTVTINDVAEPNQPPVADAGADQSITEGDAVTLHGSGSDSDGTITSYSWSGANGYTSSEQNPTISGLGAGEHTFTLTVTDDDGATGSDTVTITVNEAPSNTPPTITSISLDSDDFDQLGENEYWVNDVETYTITISGNDSDGDSITYYVDGNPISGNTYTFPAVGRRTVTTHIIKAYDGTDFSSEITLTIDST